MSEGDASPLTTDEKKDLLRHHMAETRRLIKDIGLSTENAYQDIVDDAPEPTGEMQTAEDGPEALSALRSLKAWRKEINTVSYLLDLVDIAADKFGFTFL